MKTAYRSFDYNTEYLDCSRLCRYLNEQGIKYTFTTSCGECGTIYTVTVDSKFEDYLY